MNFGYRSSVVFLALAFTGLTGCTKAIVDMLPEPGSVGPKSTAAAPAKIADTTPKSVATTTSAPVAALEAPMPEFLASFNGSSKAVGSALKKFGVAKLDTQDMDMFNLEKPAVVKTAHVGTQNCYDVHASSGVTKRGYTLCVEKGKIQKISALGANGLLPPGT